MFRFHVHQRQVQHLVEEQRRQWLEWLLLVFRLDESIVSRNGQLSLIEHVDVVQQLTGVVVVSIVFVVQLLEFEQVLFQLLVLVVLLLSDQLQSFERRQRARYFLESDHGRNEARRAITHAEVFILQFGELLIQLHAGFGAALGSIAVGLDAFLRRVHVRLSASEIRRADARCEQGIARAGRLHEFVELAFDFQLNVPFDLVSHVYLEFGNVVARTRRTLGQRGFQEMKSHASEERMNDDAGVS